MPAKRNADEPHDVLAAEEFVVPAPDPALHHEDLGKLPPPLVGTEEPQEILAAEEFAMPSPDEAHVHGSESPPKSGLPVDLRIVAGAVVALFTLKKVGGWRMRKRKARKAERKAARKAAKAAS